jgi:hypothetical protein
VYEHVPRSWIIEALKHLRELWRQVETTNERERLAAEQREVVAKYLISNLPRTGEHPTLKSLIEVAETFLLTIGATHQLFGYDLESLRQQDLLWNTGRTHIVESYIFDRDMLIDVPSELATEDAFQSDAMLTDLVREWQFPIPIRILDGELWRRPGSFYVHVGTEDSETASLPPGSMALVDPVDQTEAMRPNPKLIYLLQFGNGYRCSRCVVTHGRLHLLTTSRKYVRALEFACPREVRVAGRVRMFAHQLPQPEHELQDRFRAGPRADLVLPWEQRTRHGLFSNEQTRFQRTKQEETVIRERLKNLLQTPLTARTERRYRRPSLSDPHVSTLIQLTVLYFLRYSDSLRVSGLTISDRGRYSLDMLLNAQNIDELSSQVDPLHITKPQTVWNVRRREFLEWAPLLSFKFPKLNLRHDLIVRLSRRSELQGLDPPLASGSWMLLKPLQGPPETAKKVGGVSGWSQRLYVLRRELAFVTGYLERDSSGYALLSTAAGVTRRERIGINEISSLQQVVGVAVPV